MISYDTMLSWLNLSKTLFRQRYQFCCRVNIRYVSEFDKSKLTSIFSQTENNAMYQHLKSHQNYRQTLAFLDYLKEKSNSEDVDAILNEDFSRIPKHKLVDYFKSICHSHCCDPERFKQPKFVAFCNYLIGEIPQLQDSHLLNILKILTLWPRTEDGNTDLFYRICKAVDEEACKRKSTCDRDQVLLTIDHFHRLGVMNYSSFAWQNLGRLCRSPGSLTANQLVQTLFLVMCNRKWHPSVNHFDWENALATIIYELSAEEATIVALGFFKTNKRITNRNLLNALIMKLESRVDTLDSVSLTALLKVIGFSLPCGLRLRLIPLLDKLKEVIDKHSLTCCVHIASLGSKQPVFHEEVLNKIYSRFVKEISTARLKEIERMIFIASVFSFNPNTDPNFFDFAIKELKRRVEETSEFPKSLIYAVQFLCVKGVFDYDLMNKVLSENFLADTFKRITKFSIPNNVVEIACSAKLDCLDYAGNNLDSTLINDFNELYNSRSYAVTNRPNTKREALYMQARIKLEELFGGPQFVHLTHVLPYSTVPHLIFCQKDNVPVVLPDEIRKRYYLDFEPALEIGDWYALEVWSAGLKIGNTGEPVGSIRLKLRHLKSLGYKCLLLDEEKWLHLETDKVKYLKSLIKTCR